MEWDVITVKPVAHRLLVHPNLLGHLCIGVLKGLTTNPFDQSIRHLAGGVHLGHRGCKRLITGFASQARRMLTDMYSSLPVFELYFELY